MDPALLVEIMGQYEALVEQLYTLSAYGSLWFSADTQSTAALTYRQPHATGFDRHAEPRALL